MSPSREGDVIGTASLLKFMVVCMIAYVTPGPDWLLVARSALHSRRKGLIATFGVQTGLIAHGAIAAVGLSALIASAPAALTVIQLVGAAYIVVLGVRGAVNAKNATGLEFRDALDEQTDWRTYRECALANLLNPKAVLFFVAVVPQFISPGLGVPAQVGLLTAIDVALGVAWWAALTFGVRKAVQHMRTDRTARRLNITASVALVVVGVVLAVVEISDVIS